MTEPHVEPALSAEQFQQLLDAAMPQVEKAGMSVLSMGWGTCQMRMVATRELIRPGETISGPAMFALADVVLYGAVLSRIGFLPLTVTSTMTINFLRKPSVKPMVADARVIRVGRRSAYGDVTIRLEGEDEPVCHATGSYAIPVAT